MYTHVQYRGRTDGFFSQQGAGYSSTVVRHAALSPSFLPQLVCKRNNDYQVITRGFRSFELNLQLPLESAAGFDHLGTIFCFALGRILQDFAELYKSVYLDAYQK